MYPVELIEIQIKFAKKAQEFENVSFSNALLRFTPVARFLGIKYSEMSVENPVWVGLISKLAETISTKDQARIITDFKKIQNISDEESLDIKGNPRAEFEFQQPKVLANIEHFYTFYKIS